MSQRTSRSVRRSAATLFVGVLTLTACGSSDPADTAAESGPTLTVNTSFVLKSLDPAQVYEATGNTIVHALYDTLVTFEGDDISEPVGELAESFTASDDAKTFTFTLRKDAVFSDGSPVAAEDVVFSLNRLKNMQGSPAVKFTDLTFEAPDEQTVVVTSESANPNVPTIMAMPETGVLNSEAAKAGGGTDAEDAASSDKLGASLNTTPLGSGPYTIESFDLASRVVLTANDKYWGDKPAYSRVVVQNMDVQNQKLTMTKNPESQIALDLSGNALDGLPAELQQTGAQDTLYQLRFSMDPSVSEVSSNLDFIRAVRASIDFEGVADLFGKEARPAAGLVPTAFPGSLPESDAQQQDLDAAKSFLDTSGVTDPTISMLYPSITYRGVDLGTVAAKVQSDAKKAGITIDLEPAPIASFLDKRRGGKVELSLSPQSLDYPVAASMVGDLMPGGGAAEAAAWTEKNADPDTVASADAVQEASDVDSQIAALQDWQRLMNENSPYVVMAYNSGVVVASENLTGAVYTPAGWQVDFAAVGSR